MAGLFDPSNNRRLGLGSTLLTGAYAPKTRRVFFSFHYVDIMRVNNVRRAWEIASPPESFGILPQPTSYGFYDGSLWEKSKRESPESLKNLIRGGMDNTSVVCVLIGSETWQRPWVKYEIARSVVDGKGLLAVHINSIKHHQRKLPDDRGSNPLLYMGLARKEDGKAYLCEWGNCQWRSKNVPEGGVKVYRSG